MARLFEADFLSVDLKSLIQKSNGAAASGTQTGGTASTGGSTAQSSAKAGGAQTGAKLKSGQSTAADSGSTKKKPNNYDWEKDLNDRHAANNQAAPENRRPAYEIEQEFWTEYFTNGWGEQLAKVLLNFGTQLQKDIKALGLKKKSNPIVAFLKLKYVKTKLLPKLLNSHTYLGLRKAISKNWTADVEFCKANNYNLIYCPDLYTKSPAEIEKYLELQKQTLPPNTATQGPEAIKFHLQTFLALGYSTVTDEGVKLKDLKEITKILSGAGAEAASKKSETDSTETDEKQGESEEETTTKEKSNSVPTEKFLNSVLTTKADVLAALQFLSLVTNNKVAQKHVSSLSKNVIITQMALAKVAKNMPLIDYKKDKGLVNSLVKRFNQLSK